MIIIILVSRLMVVGEPYAMMEMIPISPGTEA